MPQQINIRFYRELNDFLPRLQRNTEFSYEIKKERSVKDLIESIGAPHTEVDIILVNGMPVDFSLLIRGGEQIHVYPSSYPMDSSSPRHNQPEPLSNPRFVVDVHLGRLAAYLRMLGFDTLYRNDYDDPVLADISANEQRILLTCDRKLLMRKQIVHGYLLRSRIPRQQIKEVLFRFDLFDHPQAPSRCMHCNGIIQAVDKKDIESLLLPLTKRHYSQFFQCNVCKKIYWEGSHYHKMQALIKNIRSPD